MKNIIIIRFSGGLGNQFFIYNYFLLLKNKFPNIKYYFDTTPYFSLISNKRNSFSIKYKVFFVLNKFYNLQYLNKYLCKILYRIGKVNSKTIKSKFIPLLISEKDLTENSDLLKNQKISIISGLFINKNYIQNSNQFHFDFEPSLNQEQKDLLREITNTNSVSLHIRGGQYIKEKEIAREYASINNIYYKKTIEFLKTKVNKPVFYVFTNDHEYAMSFFNGSETQMKIIKNNDDFIDFYLMKNCKNNIIINSTFSWWAAYINANENKIITAPKKWSGRLLVNEHYDNICLEDWILFTNE